MHCIVSGPVIGQSIVMEERCSPQSSQDAEGGKKELEEHGSSALLPPTRPHFLFLPLANNALYSKPIGGEVRDSGSSHFPKPHLLAWHWGQTFNMPVRDGIHIYTLAVGFCVPVYTAEPTAIPDVMHVDYRVRGKYASVGCHKGDP